MTTSDRGRAARLLSVATLVRTHGVRGELKLRADADLLEVVRDRAEQGRPVWVRPRGGGAELELLVESVRGHDSAPIIAFVGIDDRERADQLRGAGVCVPRSELPPLDDGEFYLVDLVGCRVLDAATGDELGAVVDARALPASTVLEVRFAGGREVLVPVIDDAVPTFDLDAGVVSVDLAFLAVDRTGAPLDGGAA